ncbi:MAG: hypothetical protein JWM55_1683 [Acidimicrobiaceae bacterium]|nr:hypothetical protein [Acidimicrobiaceae bacterium]
MRDADPFPWIREPEAPSGPLSDAPLEVIDLDVARVSPLAANATLARVVIGHSTNPTSADVEGVDIALTTSDGLGRPWVHVEDLDSALAAVRTVVARNPVASVVVAQVMRASEGLDAARALLVESLAYGMLQDGREHTEWLAHAHHHDHVVSDGQPDVEVDRVGDELTLTFNRARQRNAYRARTRDELVSGLELALLDDRITTVHLRGRGPSFGSGGDLSEFGTVHDGATGHLIRSAHNAAGLLSRMTERTVAHVQGPCYGAGVELSAACTTVLADVDTTMTLPEVAMGLIPGAGGTWSVPRRIGRHRAAWLAVTGETMDVDHALEWGLVDEVRRR